MSVPSLDSSKLLQAAAMESAILFFWIVGFSRWLQNVFLNLRSLFLVLWKMRMQDVQVDVHRIAR